MIFDQAIIEEGVGLTVIGMGTAFTLLVVLMAVVMLVGRLSRVASGKVSAGVASRPDEPVADARDKALAAVVAVGAVLEVGASADTLGGDSG